MHRKGRKPCVPTHPNGCTALSVRGQWRHCLKSPCSGARPQPACGPAPALHFLTERNESRRPGRSFAQAAAADRHPSSGACATPSLTAGTGRDAPADRPALPRAPTFGPGSARPDARLSPRRGGAGRGAGRLSWARPGRGPGGSGWEGARGWVLRAWFCSGILSRF